jgi:peroxiredoxin-like protein
MEAAYQYTTLAQWTTGRNGILAAEGIEHSIPFSTPPEFHGQAGKWTPEHMIVASVATCYVATFVAIAGISKLEVLNVEASVTGILEKPEGYLRFTRFVIAPTITLARESDRERALRLVEKAEKGCLIARSLNGQTTVEPMILVAVPVA